MLVDFTLSAVPYSYTYPGSSPTPILFHPTLILSILPLAYSSYSHPFYPTFILSILPSSYPFYPQLSILTRSFHPSLTLILSIIPLSVFHTILILSILPSSLHLTLILFFKHIYECFLCLTSLNLLPLADLS